MGGIFDTLLVHPIINALVIIYHGLNALGIPYALAFSIILLTILIRVLLYPLTKSQLESSKKIQSVAPHLSKLKEKHKGDAKRLQEETMRLYKEHGVNPAAGCVPLLVQIPLMWALYSVLQHVVSANGKGILSYVNGIVYSDSLKLLAPWDTHLLGVEISKSPSHLFSSLGAVVLIVPVLTGVLQFIQSKMMISSQPIEKDAEKKESKKNESKEEDFATAFQKQSLYMFPAMIGFFAYNFPVGLSLYWNTFTIFGILQQYRISGLGGLEEWKKQLLLLKKK